MYELYYAPDNASLIVRLALEEMGLAYETRLVDRAAREQDGAAYRELNPHGLIPVLLTPDGPIFETAAILLWLSELHGTMAPRPGSPDRAAFLKWLFFLSNGFHADLRQLFYPEKFVGPEGLESHRRLTRARLEDHLGKLDALAGEGLGWFGAGEPSVFDYYAITCLRWLALYPEGRAGWFDLGRYARLENLAKRLETRDAVRRAAEAEGLGHAPFSAPRHARPAKGSAT